MCTVPTRSLSRRQPISGMAAPGAAGRGPAHPPPPPPTRDAVVAVVVDGGDDDATPVAVDVRDGGKEEGSAATTAPRARSPTPGAAARPATGPIHVNACGAALARACPRWRAALDAAAAAAAPPPHLTLRVGARRVPAALALLRLVHDVRDVPCGGDGPGQVRGR